VLLINNLYFMKTKHQSSISNLISVTQYDVRINAIINLILFRWIYIIFFILMWNSTYSQSQPTSLITCDQDQGSPIPYLDLGNQFGTGNNTSRGLYAWQTNYSPGNFLYIPLSTNSTQFWSNNSAGNPTYSYNTINTGSGGTGGTATLFNMVLNGTFIVDESIYIQYSLLLMGENAKIIVNPNCTLKISMTTIRACGNMHLWDRIEVQPGALLTITDNSIIEDAKVGVYAMNNSIFSINHSFFNKNKVGIEVQGPNVLGFINSGVYFECYTDATSYISTGIAIPDVLNAPFSTQRSEIGVLLHDLSPNVNFTIGIPNNIRGYFGNLDYGIKAYNSSFKVINNRFVDINNTLQSHGANLIGTAIFIDGTPKNGSSNSSAIIGDINTGTNFRNCIFENCKRGVYSIQSSSLVARGNTFIDNSYICLDVRDNIGKNINVEQNTFTNFWNGCRFRNCINSSSFNITANTFNGPLNLPPGLVSDYAYTGLVLVNTPIGNTNTNINENLFNDVRIAVYGNMIDNVNIESNQIYFNRAFADLQNKAHAAFWIEGSNRITAQNNNVFYSNITSVPPFQLNSFKSLLRGFNLKALTNSTLNDNLVSACGTPIRMIDDCNFTYLKCNTFNACAQGLLFQNLILPKQGSANSAAGNYWTNFNPIVNRVLGNLIYQTDYYHISSATELPIPYNCPNFAKISTTQQSLCGYALQDPNLDISRIDDIINEASNFSNGDELTKEKERIDVFQKLKDSIDQDPAYQVWMGTVANSSTGIYSKLIDANEDRLNIINELSQINIFEDTRLADKRNLFVKALQQQHGDTTVNYDTLALENLANTNAWDGTAAVFLARGILGLEVEDEELGLRLANNEEHKNCSLNATLQGDILSLSVEGKCLIDMYDAIGRKIESLETQNSMNVNTTTYKQKGVQVIRIYNTDCQKVIKLP